MFSIISKLMKSVFIFYIAGMEKFVPRSLASKMDQLSMLQHDFGADQTVIDKEVFSIACKLCIPERCSRRGMTW
jgi:hypothetical protein